MSNLTESLLAGDLKLLVKNIFEIDSYKSKLGEDKNTIVLSFTVKGEDPARDLEKFIDRGYDFVIDSDFSVDRSGDDLYKVYVELKRTKKSVDQILEILNGVKKLAEIEFFRFRYYKSFRSHDATSENLTKIVPTSGSDYELFIKNNEMNNYSNFFNKSFLENIHVDDNNIIFEKIYATPLALKIKDFGFKKDVYNSTPGKYMIESADTAEVLFLTKYLGNYNINKIGDIFILENENYALALEKL